MLKNMFERKHNIKVEGIPLEWSHQNLYNLFRKLECKFGPVFDCRVSYDFKWNGPSDKIYNGNFQNTKDNINISEPSE